MAIKRFKGRKVVHFDDRKQHGIEVNKSSELFMTYDFIYKGKYKDKDYIVIYSPEDIKKVKETKSGLCFYALYYPFRQEIVL